MSRIEKSAFISYRRTNQFHALAVYQDLRANGYDVFLDYNNIDSGSFEKIILENIASRAHFIVILTPSALERCDTPGDWLRREIEYALDMKRNIVPLMFDGFDYGTPSIAKYLTGKLALLKQYNAQIIPSGFFEEAMAKVRTRFLNVDIATVIHPASVEAQNYARDGQRAATAQPAVPEQTLSASEWFEKGLKYGAGQYEDKIHAYTQAIRLKPDYAEAYNNRGVAYTDLKRYDEAIRDYTEALRLKPDFADAYYNRGIAYSETNRNDEAIRDYNEALRLKPDYATAYNNRGIAYNETNRNDEAIRDYNEALRLKPDDATAYNNRGVAYLALKRYDEAISDYTNTIRLQPDDATAYYNRAVAHKNINHYREAIADYQKYLDLGGGIRDGDQAQVEGYIRDLKAKL